MELKKKLILDEAPSELENSRRLKAAQKNMSRAKHAAANSAIYHGRADRRLGPNKINKGSNVQQSNTQQNNNSTIDPEKDWFSHFDKPEDITRQFELVDQNTKLKIIKGLFKKVDINLDPTEYFKPSVWITWFRAMKAKEILRGRKNVFMNILAEPQAKKVLLHDEKVFNIVYNAYTRDYLDETLGTDACGKNFMTIVLNSSTYNSGQALENVLKIFRIINNLIQKSDGTADSWTKIFNLVCDPKTKQLKNYYEINDSLKEDDSLESNKISNKERTTVFNKSSEQNKEAYLNKYVEPILKDPYTKNYIKKKYNEIQNKQ